MSGFFSELPDNVRLPFAYAEFDPTAANQGLGVMPYTVLLTGQMLDGAAEPFRPYRPTSAAEGARLFGRGSMLAQMVEAYLQANAVTKMLAIGAPDFDGGVAAAGAVNITGQVTSPAPLCLYVGGILVRLSISYEQTGSAAGAALRDLINSRPDLPVTARDSAGAVELVAKHKGACGNDIDLRLGYNDEAAPEGLAVEITPMAGGAGNPDAAEVIAAMAGERYHVIAWPWLDKNSLYYLKNEMDDRWGPLRQSDGQVVVVKRGSFAETLTFSGEQNGKHLTVIPSEGSPTLNWVDCAASAGVIAYYGNDDPARPFHTLTIPGVLAPARADRWSDFPEKNQALFEGCSTRFVTPSGETAFSKLITTHRMNNLGATDEAYLSLNSPLTLSYLRWDWNNYLKLKYPRHKLAGDEVARKIAPGQPVMTPTLGRAEAISRCKLWVEQALVEAPGQFARDIVVRRNAKNANRLDWLLMPDLVNQFDVAGTCIRHLI